jgi:hypothetical protein
MRNRDKYSADTTKSMQQNIHACRSQVHAVMKRPLLGFINTQIVNGRLFLLLTRSKTLAIWSHVHILTREVKLKFDGGLIR